MNEAADVSPALRSALGFLALALMPAGCGGDAGSSQVLELVKISGFGMTFGPLRFEPPPSALSEAQRTLVNKLRPVQPIQDCVTDLDEFVVTLRKGSNVVDYQVNPQDVACREAASLPRLAFTSVKPLLSSLPCLTSDMTRGSHDSPSSALSIHADTGCFDSFFGEADGNVIWVKLEVAVANVTHVISVESRKLSVLPSVFDSSGNNLIAAGAPVSNGDETARLELMLPNAGTFLLKLETSKTDEFSNVYFVHVTTRP